jgi:hypothetical protein
MAYHFDYFLPHSLTSTNMLRIESRATSNAGCQARQHRPVGKHVDASMLDWEAQPMLAPRICV